MFYHYHCVAFIHKAVEHVEKYLNILKMQSCGRLIENKHRVARTLASKLGSKLHTLAFSSRQCTRWLSELDVSKPYILQHLYLLENCRNGFKKLHGLIYRHVENVGNRFSLEAHLKRFTVVALSAAGLTRHEHIGEEIHLHSVVAVSLARLTASALDVKGESARFEALGICVRGAGEKLSDIGKQPRVRRRV